ncbi:MAG: cellulase family glycosylhydrolase [Bacteroidales bacterium]|nr:cellulase family glycosylhydrolase [Bacteroidales bacterium]
MKTKLLSVLAIAALTVCSCSQPHGRWSADKANKWYSAQPWLSGCNYIPCDAINQIEMWSADSWSPAQIEKELGWAADSLGFNTMRVFLSSVVYANDPDGLKTRMDEFLKICDRYDIMPMFVFFDDCWNSDSSYGLQPAPKPGIHNSGWVQDPSKDRRADTLATWPELEKYVKDIIGSFRLDNRILMWDLYNEPGNSGHGYESFPLLKNAFKWAREAAPAQPLTVGVWTASLPNFNAYQLENSDIISFHDYGGPERMTATIDSLERRGRPLVCTEYMARTRGSLFTTVMPILKERNVAAINWGFVAGKTNTIFAWDTPLPELSEPPVWFHDIYRPDGSVYDPEEIAIIRRCNALIPAN